MTATGSARRPLTVRPSWFGVAALLGVAALAFTNHFACPWAAVTGFPCPGCGMTRALLALGQGDIHAAWAMHPLVFVLVPVAVWIAARVAVYSLRARRRGAPFELERALPRSAWLWGPLCVAVFSVWLARFAGFLAEPAPIPHFSFAGWRAGDGGESPSKDNARR